MNDRFPVLAAVSLMMRYVGWLLAVAAMLYGLYEGVVEPNQVARAFGPSDVLDLITGGAGVALGLLLIGAGEVVGVLFAIEHNTRPIAANTASPANAAPSAAPLYQYTPPAR